MPAMRCLDHKRTLLTKSLLYYGQSLPNHPGKWWLHAQLRKLFGVRVTEEQEVVRGGIRWVLTPSDFPHAELFWLGTSDSWDVYHLERVVRPGNVILDIGANFGYYGITLATALDRRCRVHAVEPNPPTYALLCRHIEMNKLEGVVIPHRLGLSDTRGSAFIINRPDNSGGARLCSSGEGDRIDITTLDAFCEKESLESIDLIKIDVEGFEEHLLRGGLQVLSRFKPVVFIELWQYGLARENSSVEKILEILQGLGYRPFLARRKELIPLVRLPAGEDWVINAFCFHKDQDFTRIGII